MYFVYLTFLATFLALFFEILANYKNLTDLLEAANEELLESARFRNFAYWNFTVNMSKSTQDIYIDTALTEAKIWRPLFQNAFHFSAHDLKNQTLRQQLKMLQRYKISVISNADYANYLKLCTDMERLYGEAHICSYENATNCNLRVHADLIRIFAEQRKSDVLKYYWETFYNDVISKTKQLYYDYFNIYKKALIVSNSGDINRWWIANYDQTSIRANAFEIYKSLSPFYIQLHAYVRHRLRLYYGSELVTAYGPIPLHLLGSIWAEDWSNIQDIILPYPKRGCFDVTAEMRAQNYNVAKMYRIADNFMQSLGLRRLPAVLWRTCIGEPNPKLKIYCRPLSFDFYKRDDICVRSCTSVSHRGFQSVYHEIGHLQYFLQYAKKPFLLRDAPSPDLHETIGDVIALSAMSPKHLQQIGLLKNYTYDEEARINYLFRVALEKIVFIPFALSADEFFLSLLRNEVKPGYLNCAFWQIREDYTGVRPPVERTNDNFHVFANYYIAGDVELMRFIQAIVLQFHLYKSACMMSKKSSKNQNDHLENCNFYRNSAVGEALHSLLSTGAEKSKLDAICAFGNQGPASDAAIKDYFEPLMRWLEKTNRDNNISIGWWSSSQNCLKTKMSKGTGGMVVQSILKLILSAFLSHILVKKFLL